MRPDEARKILGVTEGATYEEIKKAWVRIRRATLWKVDHGDKKATEISKQANLAYECLNFKTSERKTSASQEDVFSGHSRPVVSEGGSRDTSEYWDFYASNSEKNKHRQQYNNDFFKMTRHCMEYELVSMIEGAPADVVAECLGKYFCAICESSPMSEFEKSFFPTVDLFMYYAHAPQIMQAKPDICKTMLEGGNYGLFRECVFRQQPACARYLLDIAEMTVDKEFALKMLSDDRVLPNYEMFAKKHTALASARTPGMIDQVFAFSENIDPSLQHSRSMISQADFEAFSSNILKYGFSKECLTALTDHAFRLGEFELAQEMYSANSSHETAIWEVEDNAIEGLLEIMDERRELAKACPQLIQNLDSKISYEIKKARQKNDSDELQIYRKLQTRLSDLRKTLRENLRLPSQSDPDMSRGKGRNPLSTVAKGYLPES